MVRSFQNTCWSIFIPKNLTKCIIKYTNPKKQKQEIMSQTMTPVNRRRKSSAPVFGNEGKKNEWTPKFRRHSLVLDEQESTDFLPTPVKDQNRTSLKKFKKTLRKVLRLPRKCSKALFLDDDRKDSSSSSSSAAEISSSPNESLMFWEENYDA